MLALRQARYVSVSGGGRPPEGKPALGAPYDHVFPAAASRSPIRSRFPLSSARAHCAAPDRPAPIRTHARTPWQVVTWPVSPGFSHTNELTRAPKPFRHLRLFSSHQSTHSLHLPSLSPFSILSSHLCAFRFLCLRCHLTQPPVSEPHASGPNLTPIALQPSACDTQHLLAPRRAHIASPSPCRLSPLELIVYIASCSPGDFTAPQSTTSPFASLPSLPFDARVLHHHDNPRLVLRDKPSTIPHCSTVELADSATIKNSVSCIHNNHNNEGMLYQPS